MPATINVYHEEEREISSVGLESKVPVAEVFEYLRVVCCEKNRHSSLEVIEINNFPIAFVQFVSNLTA